MSERLCSADVGPAVHVTLQTAAAPAPLSCALRLCSPACRDTNTLVSLDVCSAASAPVKGWSRWCDCRTQQERRECTVLTDPVPDSPGKALLCTPFCRLGREQQTGVSRGGGASHLRDGEVQLVEACAAIGHLHSGPSV